VAKPDGPETKTDRAGDRSGNAADPDRRTRRRAAISLPIRVRRELASGGQADDVSITLDVSRGGVLFITSCADYRPEMAVKVILPYNPVATAQPDREGNVVRVKLRSDGQFAVAVSFERRVASPPGIRGAYAATSFYTQAEESKPLAVVIDADPHIRLSVSHLLRMDGYEVLATKTLLEVQEQLEIAEPRFLIAENEGADFSGYELRVWLKSMPNLRNTKLVLLTKPGSKSIDPNTTPPPNVIYVTKPFRPQRFRELLQSLAPSKAEEDSHYSDKF
jgi:CheY-like chemotaxis protein